MKSRPRWIAGGLLASVLLATGAITLAVPAMADTTPVWEQSNPDSLGTLTFYNSSGDVINNGKINASPFVAYAEASTDAPADAGGTYVKAQLFFATPNSAEGESDWTSLGFSANTSFPNVSAPGALATATNPVVTGSAKDGTLATYATGYASNDPTTGYTNVYQVRMYVAATDNDNAGYWAADVLVDPSAGTWTQIYPEASGPTSTSVALTTSPQYHAVQDTAETLTATMTPSSAVGSVAFYSGSTPLGTAPVSSGVAQLPPTVLPVGSDDLTAVFTPTDSTAFAASTSFDVSFDVTPGTAPGVLASATVGGSVKVGSTVSCSAQFSSATTTTYVWKNNGATISGATSSKLALGAGYYNHSISCTATGHNNFGQTASSSSSHKAAAGSALKASKKPTLSGTFKSGKTVKVAHGTWSPSATSYTYQWKLNGKSIKHATKSSYKLVSGDKGKKITCTVTAKKTGYGNGSSTTSSKKVSK